jgi:biotin operon repressor
MAFTQILDEAFRLRGSVSSGDLQRALGITRQSAWERIRRLVESGVLLPDGHGRGTRYRPGPMLEPASTPWPQCDGFWSALTRDAPSVGYVHLASASRGFSRKSEAETLLLGVERHAFLVLDFDGVERVQEPFARHLLCEGPEFWNVRVMPINATAQVRRMLARVLALAPIRQRIRAD